MFSRGLAAAALAPLLLAGCIMQGPTLAALGAGSERLELAKTAFFPDETRYGAAAALATLLYTDGVATGPEVVASKLGVATGAVELQPALRAAAIAADRVPSVLAPQLPELIKELRDGRPVLVLLNTATSTAPTWRYAVLIGYEPANDTLLLRSGKDGRVAMSTAAFLAAWRDGGNFALVTTQPAKIPVTATLPGWIAASEAATSLGRPQLAEAAADAASARWPEQVLPWVALGNARYALMNYAAAQTAYVKALQLKDNNPVVHNNLALVLLERRCIDLAGEEVDKALAGETNAALRASYMQTQARITRYDGPSIFCPPPGAAAQAPIEYDVVPLNPDSPRAPKARPKRTPKPIPKR